VPPMMCHVAQVCLRSCQRKSDNPAASQAVFHAVLISVGGLSIPSHENPAQALGALVLRLQNAHGIVIQTNADRLPSLRWSAGIQIPPPDQIDPRPFQPEDVGLP
jgi:hypothetical protein